MKFFCLSLLFLLFASALVATELEGDARVLDSSHLELDGKPIRLYGIAAPHLKQTCEWPNKTVACGQIARTAMMDLIAGAKVVCREKADTHFEETVAVCYAGGFDIGANMVHTGWALADPSIPSDYAAIETNAKKQRHGLWKGRFVPPWEWEPQPE